MLCQPISAQTAQLPITLSQAGVSRARHDMGLFLIFRGRSVLHDFRHRLPRAIHRTGGDGPGRAGSEEEDEQEPAGRVRPSVHLVVVRRARGPSRAAPTARGCKATSPGRERRHRVPRPTRDGDPRGARPDGSSQITPSRPRMQVLPPHSLATLPPLLADLHGHRIVRAILPTCPGSYRSTCISMCNAFQSEDAHQEMTATHSRASTYAMFRPPARQRQ